MPLKQVSFLILLAFSVNRYPSLCGQFREHNVSAIKEVRYSQSWDIETLSSVWQESLSRIAFRRSPSIGFVNNNLKKNRISC